LTEILPKFVIFLTFMLMQGRPVVPRLSLNLPRGLFSICLFFPQKTKKNHGQNHWFVAVHWKLMIELQFYALFKNLMTA